MHELFGATTLQIIYVHSDAKLVESNCKSQFCVKNTQFEKKNQPNRSSDEGDIDDLKISGVADIFRGDKFAYQIYMIWGEICKI